MPYLPLLLFAFLYAGAALAWDLPWLVAGAYVVTSLSCFVAYAIDKSAARKGGWRTPERTLLLLGLVGGWPGGLLAQQWLRHKSTKRSFQRLFWMTVAANVAGFVYLSSRMAGA
ncbi:DUF1294 domain-containing protein [Massilia sp. YIM B02769]|uniref:DUF1294 domain-containing protein n=1 Tax=unclassified Massilia TaxID=2609279 RepID=UPI0025B68C6B|nr:MULTISPECIES: DUF1294 domain-containing protein [unclassified Massilia]MDN4059456.1 DUF1294 domain-containing protein [Massilia sp. YIM B02769]